MPWKRKLRLGNAKVAQSIATLGGDLYTLQVRTGGEYRGDLTVSRIDLATGKRTGRMWLRGFGHGVAFGVELVDGIVWLWVECGPIVHVGRSARGTRITRIPFSHGRTLTRPGGVTIKAKGPRCTPSVDVAGDAFCIRWWNGTGYRFGVYSLPDAREGRLVPLMGSAYRLGVSGVFQGHQLDMARHRILCSLGEKGHPLTVAAIDLSTGKTSVVKRIAKTPGYFEAEGITLHNGHILAGAAVGPVGARRLDLYRF